MACPPPWVQSVRLKSTSRSPTSCRSVFASLEFGQRNKCGRCSRTSPGLCSAAENVVRAERVIGKTCTSVPCPEGTPAITAHPHLAMHKAEKRQCRAVHVVVHEPCLQRTRPSPPSLSRGNRATIGRPMPLMHIRPGVACASRVRKAFTQPKVPLWHTHSPASDWCVVWFIVLCMQPGRSSTLSVPFIKNSSMPTVTIQEFAMSDRRSG
jgi:hypothetical protein